MNGVEFRILGPIEARVCGQQVDLGRPRQRALLAALLSRANTVVPTSRLIDLLWAEPPERASVALHVYVSGLRRVLEPTRGSRGPAHLIVTRPPGYMVAPEEGAVDAMRFEALAGEGHRLLAAGDLAGSRERTRSALSLWRGPPLAEFDFAPFAQPEAARLEELRVVVLEDRLEADLALGDNLSLVAELEMLVIGHPLRERLWALLMVSLYRADRQADALRAFGRARATLVDALGVEPGPTLRNLEAAILRQDPSLDGQASATSGWRRPRGSTRPDGADPPPQVHAAPAGFVGRESQLGMLGATLATARAGQTQVVLVSGEPGVGKTSLVQELAALAATLGVAVAWGRCRNGEGTPSFWPWVQVLHDLLSQEGFDDPTVWGPSAAEIAQIAPELRGIVPDAPALLALDATEARAQLYEAVVGAVERLAAIRPFVVALDDLHWADVATLELVQFVAERVSRAPVLFVLTYRDVDPAIDHPLASTLSALSRQRVHRLPLAGLSEDEVRRLIARSGLELGGDVTAVVHRRTDGNPFFVTELVRLLGAGSGRTPDPAPARAIPAGVRDVIRGRLATLEDRTRALLTTASVLGRDVDVALLAAADRCSASEALDLLRAAVAVGILLQDWSEVGRYHFSHALVQEALYDELAPAIRARSHADAARALDAVFGDDPSHAVELAHHLYLGAPAVGPEKGIDAALRAADVAKSRLAYEQAEEQLRRALDLVSTMSPGAPRSSRELEVQHCLAALLTLTQGYHAASVATAWERARELATELGETPEVLASVWGLARLARARGELATVQRLGNELLDVGGSSQAREFFAAGHETLGIADLFLGSYDSAAHHFSQVVAMDEIPTADGGSGALVMHPSVVCRSYLGVARLLLGDADGAYELADSALALAVATRHPLNEGVARLIGCMSAILQGDVGRAVEWGKAVDAIIDAAGIGPLATLGEFLTTWARARQGEAGEALADMNRCLADLTASGWRLAWTFLCGLRADVLRLTGELDGALDACDDGLRDVERRSERFYEAELCRIRGELTLARWPDRFADAETWFKRALDVARQQGAVPFEARARTAIAIAPQDRTRAAVGTIRRA